MTNTVQEDSLTMKGYKGKNTRLGCGEEEGKGKGKKGEKERKVK